MLPRLDVFDVYPIFCQTMSALSPSPCDRSSWLWHETQAQRFVCVKRRVWV
jgi:hypothetical protein